MSSSWLATVLDQEQIEATTTITSHVTPLVDMPDRVGSDVAVELGGRLFLRYLTKSQLTTFLDGSTSRGHWVTPTAISPTDVVDWLALFAPSEPRHHALLLDPALVPVVRGPSWVRLGSGIEYYLPGGFPKEAVLDVGHVRVR